MNMNVDQLFITTFRCEFNNSKYIHLFKDPLQHVNDDTKKFIDTYFNCFYLITKIGKCLYKKSHTSCDSNNISFIQLEYLSSLFAKAYFEYKKEVELLDTINKQLDTLIKIHGQLSNKESLEKSKLYKNQMEYAQYANFHFSVVLMAFERKITLEEILRIISNGMYSKINIGVIHRRGLQGNDLLNECVQTIMELNCSIPDIQIQYVDIFEAIAEKRLIEIA